MLLFWDIMLMRSFNLGLGIMSPSLIFYSFIINQDFRAIAPSLLKKKIVEQKKNPFLWFATVCKYRPR